MYGVCPQRPAPGGAPVAQQRGGRHPRWVGGDGAASGTVDAASDVTVSSTRSAARRRPSCGRHQQRKGGPGAATVPALARSLRTEKALSLAVGSRLAWLSRAALPPEPLSENLRAYGRECKWRRGQSSQFANKCARGRKATGRARAGSGQRHTGRRGHEHDERVLEPCLRTRQRRGGEDQPQGHPQADQRNQGREHTADGQGR